MSSIYKDNYKILHCQNQCNDGIQLGYICDGQSFICKECSTVNFVQMQNKFEGPKLCNDISTRYELAIAVKINYKFGPDILVKKDGEVIRISTEEAKKYKKMKNLQNEVSDSLQGTEGPWRFLAQVDHPVHLSGKIGQDVRLSFQAALDTLILNSLKIKCRQPKGESQFIGYISNPKSLAMPLKTYSVEYKHPDNYLLRKIKEGPLYSAKDMQRLKQKEELQALNQCEKDWVFNFGALIYEDRDFGYYY